MIKKSERNYGSDYIYDEYAEKIAHKLKEKYPEELSHINIDNIAFVRKVCKSKKSGSKTYARCKAIKQPVRGCCDIAWIITTMGLDFSLLPADKKQKVIYHELVHIPLIEGGVVDHDVEDFKQCIKKFGGPNWIVEGHDDFLVSEEEDILQEIIVNKTAAKKRGRKKKIAGNE